ncbi:hypothetical protein FKM82_001896 [Ascaphus truei]
MLPNKSSNYPSAAGILQNMADFNEDYDFLGPKWNFRCTYSADLGDGDRVSCCLWDDINRNCSSEDGYVELQKTVLSVLASDFQLVDFTWKIPCWIEGSAGQLPCDIKLLSERTHINNEYIVSLYYAIANTSFRGTARCKCYGYAKCECFVPSVKLNDSYVLWVEIVNDMAHLQSPLTSVKTSYIVKPDPPGKLQAEITQHGKLKVFWSNPSSAPYTLQYQVKHHLKAAGNGSQVYHLVKETSVIIDNIQPCTPLLVQVRCKNLHGPGVWSEWSNPWVFNSQDVFYVPHKVLASTGSSASVYCFYCDKGKKVASKDLTWRLNLAEKIPQHQYTVINDYVGKVTLVKLNTTKSKARFHYDVLQCCMKTDECHHRYAELYVLDVNISISCETNGNLTIMTCIWSTLLEPSSLQFKYHRNSLYCPEPDIISNASIQKECRFANNDFYECSFQPIFLLSGYTMWIDINHQLGTLHSPPVCVIPIDVVKPFAPSRIAAEITEGAGHLNVSWKRPALPVYQIQSQLQYCMKGHEARCKTLDVSEGECASAQVPDVCVSYTVQVRCRRKDGAGYWSDWSRPVHTVLKDIRAPLKGPDFWRIVEDDPIHKRKNVTLIWQPLTKERSLCSVRGYEIHRQISKNVSWSEYIGNTTKYTFTLPEDVLTVTVLAINSLGYSLVNNNLTLSHGMSTVSTVQSLRVALINSSCAVVVWSLLPMVYGPTELVVEWKNLREEQVKWIFTPSNISRYYIEDHFVAIEKYQFGLYPIFPQGIGSPEVTYEFTKVDLLEEQNDAGLYVILPIIILSSLLLVGTLVISHQRMKKMFWKDVPNPKHCSWAQGVNFQKPDTLEKLFTKHDGHLAFGPPFLLESEAVFEDLSIDKASQKEDRDDISLVNSLVAMTDDPNHDSACVTSSSSGIYEYEHDENAYHGSMSQTSIKYATILNNPQQSRQYSSERKASCSSFDGCLLGNNAIVIGNREEEKEAFLIIAGLQMKQPSKASSNSTVSSEGFSEPSSHDEHFLERNLYYMGLASIKQTDHESYFSENPLVTYPFQDNISYPETDFMKDKSSKCIDNNYDIINSVKKAFLSYMPQFQTHSTKLQGPKETEIYNLCT